MKVLSDRTNVFLLIVVVLVGIVAVVTMLVVSSVNNNVLNTVTNFGFAVHPLYAGYALHWVGY